MPVREPTPEQRLGWRHRRVPINELGDEVYLHLVVCRRCRFWSSHTKHKTHRGACAKHLRRTGRAYRCEYFTCDGPTMVEMVMETAVGDGKLAARNTPPGRLYGLPHWDKEWG